mmetsp:Transcript_38099/g.90515  ORF Transcript_38099/g.90515 Transcript_38099/m.90515 type:complete len:293 (-) Transcript_38099:3589-4467(-)
MASGAEHEVLERSEKRAEGSGDSVPEGARRQVLRQETDLPVKQPVHERLELLVRELTRALAVRLRRDRLIPPPVPGPRERAEDALEGCHPPEGALHDLALRSCIVPNRPQKRYNLATDFGLDCRGKGAAAAAQDRRHSPARRAAQALEAAPSLHQHRPSRGCCGAAIRSKAAGILSRPVPEGKVSGAAAGNSLRSSTVVGGTVPQRRVLLFRLLFRLVRDKAYVAERGRRCVVFDRSSAAHSRARRGAWKRVAKRGRDKPAMGIAKAIVQSAEVAEEDACPFSNAGPRLGGL